MRAGLKAVGGAAMAGTTSPPVIGLPARSRYGLRYMSPVEMLCEVTDHTTIISQASGTASERTLNGERAGSFQIKVAGAWQQSTLLSGLPGASWSFSSGC